MKKYLFYTLLLVALFIGISATTTFAEETGDLTLKFTTEENYAVYSTAQRVGLTIKLTKDDQPLSGTYQLDEINVKNPTGTITFSSDGEAKIMKTLIDPDSPDPNFPEFSTEASITIKDIPVGATYQIIPDNDNNKDSNSTAYIAYYTTDNETNDVSDGNNIVNYVLKPKLTNFKINYLDVNPDYDAPDLVVLLNLYSRSMIPPSIHYHLSSNPNELIEMTESSRGNFTTGNISLKEGESIIIDDAPVGIQYYTSPDSMPTNYNCRYTNEPQSGVIWGSDGLDYNYWNTIGGDPTNLTIIKIPSGKGIDMTKEFTFKLTGSAYQPDGSYKNLNSTYLYNVVAFPSGELIETRETTFNDGVAYVKCKANQKIEIGDVKDFRPTTCNVGRLENVDIDFANKLYSLTKFEIEEVDCDDYTFPIRFPVNFTSLPVNFYIPNSRKFTGTLTIKKEITEGVPEDEEFTMKIKLTDGATDLPTEYEYTGSKEGTLVFEDGVATITLKANESITITGLPMGAVYEITEESDEYEVTYDRNVEEIKEETSVTVTNSVKTEDPVEPEEPEKETPTEESQEEKNEEVVEEKKEISDPRTGDNIVISTAIGIISFISILAIAQKVKRNKT